MRTWPLRDTERHRASPFKRGGVTVIKLDMRAEHPRQRRLAPGEEDALLQHARPHLRALITAALSTGCRRGELLSLQWSQVRRDENEDARWIVLPAAKTKRNEARVIPLDRACGRSWLCASTRRMDPSLPAPRTCSATNAEQIAVDTLRFHVRNIYDTLHVHSKSEAVLKAFRGGILR
jgi:integrase